MKNKRTLIKTLRTVASSTVDCNCSCGVQHGSGINGFLICLQEDSEFETINSYADDILPLLMKHDCTFRELCRIYAETNIYAIGKEEHDAAVAEEQGYREDSAKERQRDDDFFRDNVKKYGRNRALNM